SSPRHHPLKDNLSPPVVQLPDPYDPPAGTADLPEVTGASVRSASPVVRLPGSIFSRSGWGAASGTARLRSSVKAYRFHIAACPCASSRRAWPGWTGSRGRWAVSTTHMRHAPLAFLWLPVRASPLGGAGPLANALYPVSCGRTRHGSSPPVDRFRCVPRE